MKILRLILILSCFNLYSQIKVDDSLSVELQAYSKCFEGLKPIKFVAEKTNWNDKQICSLSDCIGLFNYDNVELLNGLKERLQEIAKLFVDSGTPIRLINGLDSFITVREKNQNLKDENGTIYISIGGCVSTDAMRKAKEIFNSETTRLLNLK